MAKKYFWLKLKNDFFQQKIIKKLKSIKDGYKYIVVLQEMQLLSLENEGYIFFENIEENIEKEIALMIDEKEKDVKKVIELLEKNNFLEISDEKIFFTDVIKNIGRESESAERVRKHRENENSKKEKALQCNVTNVTSNTEIDTELEIDKDKEIYNSLSNINNIDKPKSNSILKQELRLVIGDLKLNVDELIKLNKPVTRIKDVIEWCKVNGKGEGYIFKAIENDWNLQKYQAVDKNKSKNKTAEIKALMEQRRKEREDG